MNCARTVRQISLTGGDFSRELGDNYRQVLAALAVRLPLVALAALFERGVDEIGLELAQHGLSALDGAWRHGPPATRWQIPDLRRLILWWIAGVRVSAIAADQGRKPGSIYAKRRRLGLPNRDRGSLVDAYPFRPADLVADNLVAELLSQPVASEPAPEPVAEVLPAAVAIPEPTQPAKRKKYALAIPQECRGFVGPQTEAEFTVWMGRMAPNLAVSIRRNVSRSALRYFTQTSEDIHDIEAEIMLRMVHWLKRGSRENPHTPRWKQYDASHGLEFFQYVCKEVLNRLGEYTKVYIKCRDVSNGDDETTQVYVGANQFESLDRALPNGDEDTEFMEFVTDEDTAFAHMDASPVDAEAVTDADAFRQVIQQVSAHYAKSKEIRFRGEASLATILDSTLIGRTQTEIRRDLENDVLGCRVTKDTLTSWCNKLEQAAHMFYQRGATATLQHFGLAA